MKELKSIKIPLLSAFIWGLIGHGYRFFNLLLSHDSLNEFYRFGDVHYAEGNVVEWKISLGRFFEPLYQLIFRGPLALPWIAGLLTLIWLSLVTWLITKIFDINDKLLIVLISGFITVNLTVTAIAASYLTDLDANMFAVFTATLAVYLWNQGGWKGFLCVPFIVVTLGTYQSTLSVFITLVMFVCILRLMHGEDVKRVAIHGLKAVGFILLSGILYLLIVKLTCTAFNLTLSSGNNNSLSNMFEVGNRSIISELKEMYKHCIKLWLIQPSMWNSKIVCLINGSFIAIGVLAGLKVLWAIKSSVCSKILIVILVILLPLGMDITYILNKGIVHHLMIYAFWFIYMLVLLVFREYSKIDSHIELNKFVKYVIVALSIVIIWGNVQTANAAYAKKDLENNATLSIMTDVMHRVEDYDGYVPGETVVAFVEVPNVDVTEAFSELSGITGLNYISPVTSIGYSSYFEYVLQRDVEVCENKTVKRLSKTKTVKKMPAYPDKNCIQWVDDILVVKMS